MGTKVLSQIPQDLEYQTMTDRYIIGDDRFLDDIDDPYEAQAQLIDTHLSKVVFREGEPEDRTLARDIGDLVVELNRLAAELESTQAQLKQALRTTQSRPGPSTLL